MEIRWFIIFIFSLSVGLLFKFLVPYRNRNNKKNKKLPPGPPVFPVIGNLLWLWTSLKDFEYVVRELKHKYGPIVTLTIGSRRVFFVTNHSVAHQALIQKGAIFADRLPVPATSGIKTRDHPTINTSDHGPTWRLLRRNMTAEILHPSRVKSYYASRRWILGLIVERLTRDCSSVTVIDNFRYAMFSLLALMCFGDKLDEGKIKEIEDIQQRIILGFRVFDVINIWPWLGKTFFRKRWNEFIQIRRDRENVFVPLIRARTEAKRKGAIKQGNETMAYVDTLLELELPDENRPLNEGEIVGLCSEFLTAGTDTTSTAMQWIMANLVKYPHMQDKLYNEIIGVVGPPPGRNFKRVVDEDDLQKMPYLRAVILEGLRRHPPAHFVFPHRVTQETELGGCVIPKNSTINFAVADIGWDPAVWKDPMEFKPERFLNAASGGEAFDVTGSREIKMMPFGAGRRICPASQLGLLHLEFFVSNLIWYFEWRALDGDVVDLSEKEEFTFVMKNPLRARISPRV